MRLVKGEGNTGLLEALLLKEKYELCLNLHTS